MKQINWKQYVWNEAFPIKTWFVIYAYRPLNETNKKVFFNELIEILDKAVNNMIISL